MYRKEEGVNILIVFVYVDDLFVTGSTLEIIKEFKASMSTNFEMTNLGKLTYYLGIEVNQGINGTEVKQEAYARRILKEVGLDACNPTQIPMEFGFQLSKGLNKPEIDANMYRRRIGCLRYLLHSRPDLAFSV